MRHLITLQSVNFRVAPVAEHEPAFGVEHGQALHHIVERSIELKVLRSQPFFVRPQLLLAFFQELVTAHPSAANAHLNFGFAYVDKIPVAGAITQVILANNALGEFTTAVALQPSWIAYYTRGNSYLFWPKIFNRTRLGIDDPRARKAMDPAMREALVDALKSAEVSRIDRDETKAVRLVVDFGPKILGALQNHPE